MISSRGGKHERIADRHRVLLLRNHGSLGNTTGTVSFLYDEANDAPHLAFQARIVRARYAGAVRLGIVIVAGIGAGVVAGIGIGSTGAASAGEPFLAAGGGGAWLAKRTPFAVNTAAAIATIDAGWLLTSESAAKIRVEMFALERAANVAASLVGEARPWRYGGAFLGAGISGKSASRLGPVLALGGFARLPVAAAWDLRLELTAAAEVRNDFGGARLGASLAAEYRWQR